MPTIRANGLDFEVESFGDEARPAVLLIMGLGMQLTGWPDLLVQNLVGFGFRVVRFDNRDSGLSSKIESAGRPNLMMLGLRHFLHLSIPSPYGLHDMAADSVAILDALGIAKAHIVGASMGGMIAQLIAADHPEHVISLTSIMSTSGAPDLPQARSDVLRALLTPPRNRDDLEALIAHYIKLFKLIGSPGFPTPPELLRRQFEVSLKRSYYPVGTTRQMVAIVASGDRSAKLATIHLPTLVIHGTDDVLVPVEAGRDTARKIAGSKLLLIPGMGHDLAAPLVPILSEALCHHFTPSSR